MQTIPLNARVAVLPECRYEVVDDDDHWTGHVEAFYAGPQDYLVQFDNGQKGWYMAHNLRVLES